MKATGRFEEFWNPRGTTSRRTYATAGFGLMALKFLLDRLTVRALGGNYWGWLSYWNPFDLAPSRALQHPPSYAIPLLVLAVPFIAIGIVLTLRRLRDLGWPLALVAVFFIPALNLVLFAMLCLLPSRERLVDPLKGGEDIVGAWARRMGLGSPSLSAILAILLTILMMTPLTWLATSVFKNYGWGLFVAQPFILGMLAAMIHGVPQPRSWPACAGVALLALFFCALVVLAVAIEGLICVLMAVPIVAPLALLGATAGYFIQVTRWSRVTPTVQMYAAAWLALPAAFALESRLRPEPLLIGVTTSVVIAAPPETVWRQVVTFSELPPPRELVFRSGIAHPVRATIRGQGVGAVRHCEFSTGPFVEPITVWDEPRRLAFNVVAQPHPMRELSPYRSLHPAHLDGFFRSRRGEFLLTPLPNGATRLEGMTWYSQQLWPARYWQIWSDYLVHTIHRRVLEHIRAEAEGERSRSFSDPR